MTSIVKQVNVYAIVRDSGTPLYKASIWIGEAGEDPEYSPKRVWFVQEEGQQFEGKQPIITGVGGFPFFEGDKVAIKVEGDFSIRIRDFSGAVTYESLSGNNVTFDDGDAVPTLADLQEVDTSNFIGDEIYYVAETTEGEVDGFHVIFRNSDKSAEVAANPEQWVVPNDRAGDGSEGAYQKIITGIVPLFQPRQTGDGVTTSFASPASGNQNTKSFNVVVGGVTLTPGEDFTYNPGTGNVDLDSAPANGVDVDVSFFEPNTLITAPTDAADINYSTESNTVKDALDARVPSYLVSEVAALTGPVGKNIIIADRDHSIWEAVAPGSPDGYSRLAGNGVDWVLAESELTTKMFGGIGTTDDYAVLNAAIQFSSNERKKLTFSPLAPRYTIKKSLDVLSFTNIDLNNQELFNDASSANAQDFPVFRFGGYHAFCFTSADYRDVNPITVGDITVTTTNPGDGADFAEGDLVYLWSADGYTTGAGVFISHLQQINKVAAVNGDVITLEHAVYRSFSGVRLSKEGWSTVTTGSDNLTPWMIESAKVANGICHSATGTWARFGGALYTHISNIHVPNATAAPITFNGMAYSYLENITGTSYRLGVELAQFCHHTTVMTPKVLMNEEVATTNPDLGVISFAEGAHDNTVIDPKVITAAANTNLSGVDFGEYSYNNRVVDGSIQGHTLKTCVRNRSFQSLFTDRGGNSVQGTSFIFDTVTHAITLSAAGCAVKDCEIEGTVTNSLIEASADATNCEVSGNNFRTAGTGSMTINSAVDIVGGGNRFDGDITYPVGAKGKLTGEAWTPRTLARAQTRGQYSSGNDITSTSPVTLITTATRANAFSSGDSIRGVFHGLATGTTNQKRLIATLGGTTLFNIAIPAAYAGAYRLEWRVVWMNSTGTLRVFTNLMTNVLASTRGVMAIDTTIEQTLLVQAQVDNAADAIKVELARVEPDSAVI